MKIKSTPIADLKIAETNYIQDARGSFARLFCISELSECLKGGQVKQINHSMTAEKGTIRGMHFQRPPHAELKCVRCLRGRIWDVAIDLRKRSSTYLSWHAEILTPENTKMMIIPEGFAHGFQTLEDKCELLYLHSECYNPDAEDGVRYDDPEIGISWPLQVTNMSARDKKFPALKDGF